jgi:CRISPR-associated endonuclease/helicase Cas3
VDKDTVYLWAKAQQNNEGIWHPLILHMLDVAATSEVILAREPQQTRKKIADIFGLDWESASPWLFLVIACHDLGKACPGFQCKWKNLTDMDTGKNPNTNVKHGFVSQIALCELLLDIGWEYDLAELVSDAIGCHHGQRISPVKLRDLEGDRRSIGTQPWQETRKLLMEVAKDVLKPKKIPTKKQLSGPDFMLLAGLTSFSDWIGSNEDWFSYGKPEDCVDLMGWFEKRKKCAEKALDAIGWSPRKPLVPIEKDFKYFFGFEPRPLQKSVADVLPSLKEPSILLIEAPMGEGKTEAAFFAHIELQRRFGHRGLYVALPTKATGNAMFHRTFTFLANAGSCQKIDVQLLHGAALLNDSFQNLRLSAIHDTETGGEIRAGEWFTHKKRALLSEYGVGTVDQALLPILPVRHNFVRLWGLANRVVIFDEIHAYDAYTGTLLLHLLRWLIALGSSVVLLSATLPPRIRRKLAEVTKSKLQEKDTEYPRLSVFQPGREVEVVHFEADQNRQRTVRLIGIEPELSVIRTTIDGFLKSSGMGLVLLNTVQRAQDMYELYPEGDPIEREHKRIGKRLSDGTEVFLFHARFPADLRQKREDHVLAAFGQNVNRSGRKILIATQVAEQSLDLDFDVIATDLAPIDLILQRAGRLWRHSHHSRPVPEPTLIVSGLDGQEPPSFNDPLWWGHVYQEDLLLRTWILLHSKQRIVLPDEIDILVQTVYEDQVSIPEALKERFEKAVMNGDGDTYAKLGQANQAILGFPDDASWNDPARFVLYDEDEPGVHRTLMAQTRVGEESVIAIPICPQDQFNPQEVPDFFKAKEWFMRSISLSRKNVVHILHSHGVPEGWRQSPLLRNCFPLLLDENGFWSENKILRLDNDLGFVYEKKENK